MSRSSSLLRIGAAIVLSLLSLVTFRGVLRADFVPFDDDIEILGNAHIQQGINSQSLRWMFTDTRQTERYTPLSWLTWTILYTIWGANPLAFHMMAWLIHALNTVLVFFVLEVILGRAMARAPPREVLVAAAMGAALWSVHPLRVEVVGWITQVRFAEATTFALLATFFYVKAIERFPTSPIRTGAFWCSVAAYGISLLFYPIGIGLVVVFWLLDGQLFQRYGHAPAAWRRALHLVLEKIPFFIPAFFVAAMTIFGRVAASGDFDAPVALAQFGWAHRVMQAVYIYIHYIWKPLAVGHITPIYTTLVSFDPWTPAFVLSFAAVLGLTVTALLLWRRLAAFAVIWFSYLALILPFGGYMEHPHYPSDRYSYLAGVLWIGGAMAVGLAWWPKWRSVLRPWALGGAMAGLLALALLANTYTQNWENGEYLFKYVISDLGTDPYVVDLHVRLSWYYLTNGRFAECGQQIDRALTMQPHHAQALHVKGMLLLKLAERGQAAQRPAGEWRPMYLQAAHVLEQEFQQTAAFNTLLTIGYSYTMAREWDRALTALTNAVRMNPQHVDAHLLLGTALAQAGHRDQAAEQLEIAIQLAPSLAPRREALRAAWAALEGTATTLPGSSQTTH